MFPLKEGSLLRLIFNLSMRLLSNYLFRKASRIATVTDWLRQELVKALNYTSARIFVVRNGSEVECFAKALQVKKEFDLVYSGTLTPVRDPQSILRYFRRLADIYPSLRLFFVSHINSSIKMEFLRGIEELDLSDKIVFEQRDSPEGLPERLGRACLGLNSLLSGYPAYRGAIGAKEYEYLAAGLPVVGLMDPEYYIESGRLIVGNKVGILHQDPKRLAAETAALLKDSVRLRKMSKRARKVGERFDRKRLAEEYYYKVILPAWQEFNATR